MKKKFDHQSFLDELVFTGIKLGLENIKQLLNCLGNPQDKLKIIHVAGTNGKGSVCSYLSAAFHNAGYKTGFFCSPHLVSLRERFRINAKAISEEDFQATIEQVYDSASELFESESKPTYFEFVTAMALKHFADNNCDIVILEVGMGGRLDATNVVMPELSVITNIGLDHTEALGNTFREIAFEKAGIIKQGCPVLIGKMPAEAKTVIEDIAYRRQSKAYIEGKDFKGLHFHIDKIEEQFKQINTLRFEKDIIEIDSLLLGSHQVHNQALAWATVNVYKKLDDSLDLDKAQKGLSKALWPARLQCLNDGIILDAAHNPDAMEKTLNSLDMISENKQWNLLFASLSSKDWKAMLNAIAPKIKSISLCPMSHHRAEDEKNIAKYIEEQYPEINVFLCETVEHAMDQLKELSNGLILGSLYLAGEVLALYNNHQPVNIEYET